MQARRQDSVTEGAEINFRGAREVYSCEFEKRTRNLSQSGLKEQGEDQRFKGIFRRNRKFKRFFRPKTGDFQKKRSLFQKCHEIRCQSTKTTKLLVANTNSGLELHSSSPELVNFFGAQSSIGGVQFLFGGGRKQSFGGHGPGMPPCGAGPASM